MNSQHIVFMVFAGRRENMSVQKPYLDRLLTDYPNSELHLWNLTRDQSDDIYVKRMAGQHDGRVRVFNEFHTGHPIQCMYPNGQMRRRGWPPCQCMIHKPPYEKPYAWYANRDDHDDVIYVKMDDDVLFLETARFADLITPLVEFSNRVVSANVINNVVCAKYQHTALDTANKFEVGDPADWDNDARWWELHVNPDFARWAHEEFLRSYLPVPEHQPSYVRTRPGENVSINCIAFTQFTMKRLAQWYGQDNRLGDEGAVDRMLPWICTSFRAAHLTFGPQDKAMTPEELGGLRSQYADLAKGYLGE